MLVVVAAFVTNAESQGTQEVLPQPAPPGCGFCTSATTDPAAVVSPEDILGSVGLGRLLQRSSC
jgi:hypothetical protein